MWGTGLFSDDVACDVRDRVLSPDTRLFAFVMQQIDWQRAFSGRCKRSASAPATSRRRCQASAIPGPNSPTGTAVDRRAECSGEAGDVVIVGQGNSVRPGVG